MFYNKFPLPIIVDRRDPLIPREVVDMMAREILSSDNTSTETETHKIPESKVPKDIRDQSK